jgi:hypothetical protein
MIVARKAMFGSVIVSLLGTLSPVAVKAKVMFGSVIIVSLLGTLSPVAVKAALDKTVHRLR